MYLYIYHLHNMHKILEYSFDFRFVYRRRCTYIDPLIRGGHTALAAGPWSLANTTPSTYYTLYSRHTGNFFSSKQWFSSAIAPYGSGTIRLPRMRCPCESSIGPYGSGSIRLPSMWYPCESSIGPYGSGSTRHPKNTVSVRIHNRPIWIPTPCGSGLTPQH